MKKHFISIILMMLFLAVAVSAHARLTLGVVTSSAGEPDLMQPGQLESLVAQLHEKLQEEIVVKEMSDSATVVNWLDHYAALDMALLSREDLSEFRGRFLYVGQIDKDGQVNLVTRQGSNAELTEKMAEFVAETGYSPWQRLDAEDVAEIIAEATPVVEKQPLSIEEVIEAKSKPVEPEVDTLGQKDLSPERTTEADASPKEKLVLAVIPGLKGVLQSAEEAAQVAGYLETVLPLEVQIKEFAQLDSFALWFMRYRMVDLAVVSKNVAEAKLGRDYIPIVEISTQGSDAGPTELLVGRRGHNPSLQNALRQALLETPQSEKGQSLLATLGVESFTEPLREQGDAIAEMPEATETPAAEIKKIPVVEPPTVLQVQVVEFPEPVEPVSPALPVIASVPQRPMIVRQDVPPEPVVPDIVPATPTVLTAPPAPDLLVAPKEIDLPEAPEVAESPQPINLREFPEVPDIVKIPEAPEERLLPGSPVETLPEPVAAPTAVLDGVAVPAAPAEPETVAVPEEPQVVVSPVVISAPVLPATPDAVSLPETPEPRTLPESPEVPDVVKIPEAPQEKLLPASPVKTLPEPVAPPTAVLDGVAEPVAPAEPETVAVPEESQAVVAPVVISVPVLPAAPDKISSLQAAEVADSPVEGEESKIIEEVLEFAEPVSSRRADQIRPVVVTEEDLQDEDVIALLGESMVAALVAQPNIPQELRPPGIPVVRPGRIVEKAPAIDEGLFLTSLPEPVAQIKPPPVPKLLPDPEQDQGVLYIVPFVAIMVPKEVNDRIFDKFVDALLNESEKLELEFVILKDGLKGVDPRWLDARKYVTGEIYGYLEEAGSDVIDLRAKAKLNYHTPNQDAPAFSYLHPVSKFLDRDTVVIEEERIKLADNIAETLIAEFLGVLKN